MRRDMAVGLWLVLAGAISVGASFGVAVARVIAQNYVTCATGPVVTNPSICAMLSKMTGVMYLTLFGGVAVMFFGATAVYMAFNEP